MAFPGKLYREGNTLRIENFNEIPRLFFVEQFGFNNFLNDEIFRWIDILAQNGVNGMRVFGIWPFGRGHEVEPYLKSGDTYDLNRFNEQFFDNLKRWVAHADENGIAVLYELFDSCGFWATEFAPYNPFYQLVGSNHKKFSQLSNTPLVDIQKRYVRKVIETVKPHLNVIFGIMNEFTEDEAWHYEMSRYIKSLAPDNLTAGSALHSPAADDPNIDLWFIHKGRYDMDSGTSDVPTDADEMRRQTRGNTVVGYSTDGFGMSGIPRENPTDMRRLAQDVNRAGLQLFGFLDHKGYIPERGEGSIAQLNVETYRSIVSEFQPSPAPTPKPKSRFKFDENTYISLEKKKVPANIISKLQQLKDQEYITEEELIQAVEAKIGKTETARYRDLIVKYTKIGRSPDGFLDIFDVSRLPSTHPGAFVERGGKAIRATTEQGFLCFGQYKTGYPTIPLKALFSILIDNNTADDRNILILDVYDHHSDRVLGKRVITRKDFPKENDFSLFEFDFTPPSEEANMEFRVFYLGWSYILANKIAVIDPTEITIREASEIPDPASIYNPARPSTPGGPPPEGELVISDPLTDERSAGVVNGGMFVPEGYKVTTNFHGNILYETDIIKNIRIEFDAKGYIDREECSDNKMIALTIFDSPSDANWMDPEIWKDSHYSLLEVRKRGIVPGYEYVTNGLGLKCGSHGEGIELGSWAGHGLAGHPIEWNPNTLYHWVFTWKDGFCELIRNGQKMYSEKTLPQYNPSGTLKIRIGGTHWGRSGPRDVAYSNVKIYRL
jgi:hypothetical protein